MISSPALLVLCSLGVGCAAGASSTPTVSGRKTRAAGPVVVTPGMRSTSIYGGVVVVSSASMTVYAMEPDRGIVAIDLPTGTPKWTSSVAMRPLAEQGDALVALDAAGAVRVLDARTGERRGECDVVPGVKLGVARGPGMEESASGTSDGTHVWISWARSTRYVGGTQAPPEVEAAARSYTSGVYELDVDACTVKPGTNPFAPVMNEDVATYVTPGGINFHVTRGLRLIRRRGAVTLPEVDLARRRGVAVSVTVDHRHIVVSGFRATSATSLGFELLDVERGLVIARGETATPISGGIVIDRWLVTNHGLDVATVDLDTAQVMWRRTVQPTVRAHVPIP